jgi:hypothetical protein
MPPVIPKGVPFAQIPHDLICDLDVSHAAVRVYCYLMRRANSDGRAFPGVRRIANETGMGRNTARRGIESLKAAGWIVVEREYDTESKKHKVNQYVIHGTRVGSEWTQGGPETSLGGGSKTGTELQPSSLTTSLELVAPNSAVRERNPWWDTTVSLFGEPSEGQRKLYGRFVVMAQEWEPAQIPERAAKLAALWGHKTVTVASLEKHWSRFDAQIGQITDADVEEFAAAQRREAGIARLTDE